MASLLWQCTLLLSAFAHHIYGLNSEGKSLLTLSRTLVLPSGIKSTWKSSDSSPCRWFGVHCGRSSYVVSLNFSFIGISGSLGPEVGQLHHLERIDLAFNSLSGSIPPELGNCTRLRYMDLSNNLLSGDIPKNLGNLSRLSHLSLFNNFLHGSIPDSLFQITNLEIVYLNQNNLTGTIPPSVGEMRKVILLWLSDNLLSGFLPDSIGNCTKLEELYLDQNQLIGSLPTSLNRIKGLNYVIVSSNGLTGRIPLIPSSCKELQWLDLSNNKFEGEIPEGMGNCSSLSILDASNNSLTGQIPSSIGLLTKLSDLYLFENSLTGPIPPEIGNCSLLSSLEIYENQLEGTIPKELGKLIHLQKLSIFYNELSGELPQEMVELKNLKIIILFGNKFSGVIPQGVGINSSLLKIDLTNNFLTGAIPPGICHGRKLEILNLGLNLLNGSIPSDIGNCMSLKRMILSHNHLTGYIPNWAIGSSLNYMDVSMNDLDGSIPATVGNCVNLTLIDWSRNKLAGLIPREIGNLQQLGVLNISHNNLNGQLPLEISHCKRLFILDLGFNSLNGSIPSSFANLTDLSQFILQDNQFNGGIPNFLSQLNHLIVLQLGGNVLGGQIPFSLGSLQSLNIALNLSSNGLIGQVPPQLANLDNILSLDLSLNNLSGSLEPLGGLSSLIYVNVSFNQFAGPVPERLRKFLQTWPSSFIGNADLCDSCSPCLNQTILKPCNSKPKSSFSKIGLVAIIIGSLLFCLLVIFAIGCLGPLLKKIVIEEVPSLHEDSSLLLNKVMEVTENMDEKYVIGRGAHGTVYKASLSPEEVYAVKKFVFGVQMGSNVSMLTEIRTLGKIKHRNLMKLVNFWLKSDCGLILYEYMENGSLHDVLHEIKPSPVLDWKLRYKIAIGIAQGLSYLHWDCNPAIIHCDIKPKNILLDSEMEPHITDFGIARFMDQFSATPTTTGIMGTIGYMSPEIAFTVRRNKESDVYSYGIVLFELITRKMAVDPSSSENSDLASWVRSSLIGINDINVIIDPDLMDEALESKVAKEICEVVMLALECTRKEPSERPSMRDVVNHLTDIKSNYFLYSGKHAYEEDLTPVDVDMNPVQSFLDSFASQKGSQACLYLSPSPTNGITAPLQPRSNFPSNLAPGMKSPKQDFSFQTKNAEIKDKLSPFPCTQLRQALHHPEPNSCTHLNLLKQQKDWRREVKLNAKIVEHIACRLNEPGLFLHAGRFSGPEPEPLRVLHNPTQPASSSTTAEITCLRDFDGRQHRGQPAFSSGQRRRLATRGNSSPTVGLWVESAVRVTRGSNSMHVGRSGSRVIPGSRMASLFWQCTLLLSAFAHHSYGLNSEGKSLLTLSRTLVLPSGIKSTWKSSDSNPCRWIGIHCGQNSYVVSLNFSSIGISGSLGPEVGQLHHLERIDIGFNALSGSIPPALGNCTRLQYLDLSNNLLSGDIPKSLGNLSRLSYLSLYNNFLHGSIPDSLFQITNLETVYLNQNNLTGTIPPSVGKMRKVIVLWLSDNLLSGFLPDSIGNCTKLEELYLAQNQLIGSLPNNLNRIKGLNYVDVSSNGLTGRIPLIPSSCKELQWLDLSNNKFEGEIPEGLGNCSSLSILAADNNSLTGQIPSSIGLLTKLSDLYLFGNSLIGPIPHEIGNCSSLSNLEIYENQLEGAIPKELGKLIHLQKLYLFSNNLSGEIPVEIWKLQELQEILLYYNELAGELPQEMVKLKNLKVITLYGNKLSGVIPQGLGINSSLLKIDLINNFLTGAIPPGICHGRKLEVLNLGLNLLNGSIPSNIGNCASLKRVILSHNHLTGYIPNWAIRSSLNYVDVSVNDLNGSIPTTVGNCMNLTLINLSRNKLTGPIPPEIGNLRQLGVLNISYNNLNGQLPLEISHCKRLFILDLGFNSLSGSIPSSIANLTDLSQFILQDNQLSGGIPNFLSQLNHLTEVQLGGNVLGGKIPLSLGSLQSLNIALNLSSNRLIGEVPPQLANLKKIQSLDLSLNSLSGSLEPLGGLSSLIYVNVSFNQFAGPVPESLRKFLQTSPSSFIGNADLCDSCSPCSNQTILKPCNSKSKSSFSKIGLVAIIIGSSLFCLLVIFAIGCLVPLLKKIVIEEVPSLHEGSSLLLNKVMEATENMDEKYVIGRGAHGTVYKASLSPEEVYAVKRLVFGAQKGSHASMLTEIKTVGTIKHRNLLKLVNFWLKSDCGLILYEYMENGSLHDVLHEIKPSPFLDWKLRYKIAIGIAQGLSYLHWDCNPAIIHCDIKPKNIILDSEMEPHITDFGIARFMDQFSATPTTTGIMGTIGYMSPEIAFTVKRNKESDVYSYGIVLFELITRKMAVDPSFSENSDLVSWVRSSLDGVDDINQILDPDLIDEALESKVAKEMYEVVMLALECTREEPSERPSMRDVVNHLTDIKSNEFCSWKQKMDATDSSED
ncbi:uncharacterized protein LOC110095391 [Dendrobium catenatum]|uniref:uncharacterized protein LOC110095391 n=1 Tax=Dendrobium catenatum TaxID=906689 RepID=UPI00109FA97D|nr:uncharacterized protein LOC110095391 [Dendrobium catenatum]